MGGRERQTSVTENQRDQFILIVQVQDGEILGIEMEKKDFLIIDITCLRNY